MRKKAFSIWLLVMALVLGVSTVLPRQTALAALFDQDDDSACDGGKMQLGGDLALFPRAHELMQEICDFRINRNQVGRNVAEPDRLFLENAIAANTLEIQTLEYVRDRATNEELRSLIDTMIAMHTADLRMAMNLAQKAGAERAPNLSNARVYPGTPAYDLGMRRIDLTAMFLDPLVAAGGGVMPTPPVDLTATPGEDMTATPGADLTATPTTEMTATPTVDMTATPGTDLTATPTEEMTATPTDEMTATPSNDMTATPTMEMTTTPIVVPTDTPAGPGIGINFDLLAIDIIEHEHVMFLETALAAERLVRNDEIRAFAKHSADVARLHLLLLQNAELRFAYGITPPTPEFEADYQSPRRFEPR